MMADDTRTKALAYLKDYVGQMRAAGFSDYDIRSKLQKTGQITIPDTLPANFGQRWGDGMADELRGAARGKSGSPVALADLVPSPNEYLEYMPGFTPSRIPSWSEYSNFKSGKTTGKFNTIRMQNLMTSLQNTLQNYQGRRVGASESAYEM